MNKPWVKVLRWFGYGVFFVVALAFFVRFTFPTEQAREFVKAQIAQRLGAERVALADIGISGLFPNGGSVEGLEIELPPIKVKTPERGVDVLGPPRMIAVEELSATGSLLGLASANYDVEFEGKLQGGELLGGRFLWEKGGPLSAEIAEIKAVELGSEGLFQTLTGFDVIASLSGKLKLDIPAVDREGRSVLQLEQLATEIELVLSDAKILQPIIDTVMSREPVRMSFTDTKLGTVTVRLKAEGGSAVAGVAPAGADSKGGKRRDTNVIAIDELSAIGGDIEVALAPKATITMLPGQNPRDAVINIHLAVKIADAWFDIEVKDAKDPTKMTKPNVGLRTMMSLGPLKAFVQDGQFGVGITGTLAKPKVAPERPRTRVGSGPAGSGGGRKMNVDQGASEGEGEDEEEAPAPKVRAPPTPPPEAKARPVSPPPATSPLDRAPPRAPVVRPSVMGKGAPGGGIGRPRPRLLGPSDASDLGIEPEPGEEPHEDPGVEHEVDPNHGGTPGEDAPPD